MIREEAVSTLEEVYEKHFPLIKNRAGRFSSNFNVPYEDLISQSNEIFMKTYEAFDPSKAKFITLLHLNLSRQLPRQIETNSTRREKDKNPLALNQILNYYYSPDTDREIVEEGSNGGSAFTPITHNNSARSLAFKQELRALSPRARFIAALLLHDPAKTLSIEPNSPPRKIRGALKTFLREEMKWKHKYIWSSFNELKGMIKAFALEFPGSMGAISW